MNRVSACAFAYAVAAARSAAADAPIEAACDVAVELRGAIADVSMHQRFAVPRDAAEPRSLAFVVELPATAELIGVGATTGGKAASGVAVPAHHATAPAVPGELDPDPVLVESLDRSERALDRSIASAGGAGDRIGDTHRYGISVQAIAPGRDIVVATRWVAPATIRGGALHFVVPGRGAGATPCRGAVHASPGPGVTAAELRVDGVPAANTFVLGGAPVELAIALAFARPEPVAWVQTETLGAGFVARAITVAAPPAKPSARRAVLVVDVSRSMDLVGRAAVAKLARAVATALPAGAEIELVTYDRVAARAFGGWRRADDAATLAAIADAIGKRGGRNGSDLVAAFGAARDAIGADRTPTAIVAITDGDLGDTSGGELVDALRGSGAASVHAIVVEPAGVARGEDALRALVAAYGGAYVELGARDVDGALASAASWLDREWPDVALPDGERADLLAGTGVVSIATTRATPAFAFDVARGGRSVHVVARPAPNAPLAQLALGAEPAIDAGVVAQLAAKHPAVDARHSLVVLATTGGASAPRRQVIARGGPFVRIVSEDGDAAAEVHDITAMPSRPVPRVSAVWLDKPMIKQMFDLQFAVHARACYSRAIARAPKLEGTVVIAVELARGEVVRARVASGLGDGALDDCLVDAAYDLAPPLPDLANVDDERVIARYALELRVRGDKPIVVPGDADSETPIDFAAVRRGCRGDACFAKPPKPPAHIDAGDTTVPLERPLPRP
jgi:hypothetical protein